MSCFGDLIVAREPDSPRRKYPAGALEHAEDGAGASAVVQVECRVGAAGRPGPGVISLLLTAEDGIVRTGPAAAVGLATLEAAAVDWAVMVPLVLLATESDAKLPPLGPTWMRISGP